MEEQGMLYFRRSKRTVHSVCTDAAGEIRINGTRKGEIRWQKEMYVLHPWHALKQLRRQRLLLKSR